MIGIDLSLTGTAFAFGGPRSGIRATTIVTKGMEGRQRRDHIVRQILDLKSSQFCIEGLAFSRNDPSAQERAGVWYRVVDGLEAKGCRVIVCPPTSLKKFVCGKGNAEKSMMIREVFKRWGFDAEDDNQADAAGLLVVGLAMVEQYAGELTKAQQEVIDVLKAGPRKKRKKAAIPGR